MLRLQLCVCVLDYVYDIPFSHSPNNPKCISAQPKWISKMHIRLQTFNKWLRPREGHKIKCTQMIGFEYVDHSMDVYTICRIVYILSMDVFICMYTSDCICRPHL